MIQELVRVGPIAISPFGPMLVVSFLAAYFQLARGMKQLGVGDADAASALVVAGGLGGIAGAKVYFAILHGDWRLLFERYGLVWYGGFVVGTAAVVWTMRRRRLPVWPTLDAATPALALGYALGRIGCFLVGDDYGRPTDLPWGVVFENGLPPTTAWHLRREFGLELPAEVPNTALLAVHPTQLYESLAALAIWGVGVRRLARGGRPGSVALPLFALLAAERFLVEFVRLKDDRFFGPFTLAQALSLALLAALPLAARARPGRAAAAPAGPAAR
jgi:phosphatidylglycerol:prolipoprotein diacylglycerol transferase